MAIFRWPRGYIAKLTEPGFWSGFFDRATHSGQSVTEHNALQLDAVWACVKINAETLGTLPLMVLDAATNAPAVDHPLYELLRFRPNDENTAVELWEAVGMALSLYGNSYCEKIMTPDRDDGQLRALIFLTPAQMSVERDKNGARTYVHTTPDGKRREIREARMFHVRAMSLCDDLGMSPIEFGRNTIGNALAVEETSGKLFANGLQSAGALSTPNLLSDRQRTKVEANMQKYVGSKNAGKLMVLEAGFTYHNLTLNPETAQMLQTRRYSIEQICRLFGVPAIMIGHASEGQTMWGSGVEQIMLSYSKLGLRSMCKRIEAAIWRDLLTKEQRKKIKVEFNLEGLLRGDTQSRAAFYSTMTQNGAMTRNEVRALENRPGMGPKGDKLTVQSNLAFLDELDKVGAARLPAQAAPETPAP